DADAHPPVPQRLRAGGVGADEVPLDHVARGVGAEDLDTLDVIAGNQVAGCAGGAADGVVGSEKRDADDAIAPVDLAGLVGADEVAADDVAATPDDVNPVSAEAVDDQALDGAVVGPKSQARLEPDVAAVQLDGEKSVVAVGQRVGAGAELRVAVDEHR